MGSTIPIYFILLSLMCKEEVRGTLLKLFQTAIAIALIRIIAYQAIKKSWSVVNIA